MNLDYLDDLNPHAEARFAMWLLGDRYAKSGLGSMQFWDQLSDSEKSLCREGVDQIVSTKREGDHFRPLVARHPKPFK